MENDVYRAPESDVVVADESASMLASRWARLGAAFIDGIIIMVFILPIMYFAGVFDTIAEGIEPSMFLMLGITLVSILIFIVINGKLLLNHGKTIGKRMFDVKIVLVDDQQADLNALLKRYGFSMLVPQIPMVGPLINLVNILFIFSSSKRCIHDLVAGTKVIKG